LIFIGHSRAVVFPPHYAYLLLSRPLPLLLCRVRGWVRVPLPFFLLLSPVCEFSLMFSSLNLASWASGVFCFPQCVSSEGGVFLFFLTAMVTVRHTPRGGRPCFYFPLALSNSSDCRRTTRAQLLSPPSLNSFQRLVPFPLVRFSESPVYFFCPPSTSTFFFTLSSYHWKVRLVAIVFPVLLLCFFIYPPTFFTALVDNKSPSGCCHLFFRTWPFQIPSSFFRLRIVILLPRFTLFFNRVPTSILDHL